ncbi:MAG: hypothetical protein FJ290_22475 [Planctomycetes bacterium]|nr:hypothetical protein [Planctomycetota bacterium]
MNATELRQEIELEFDAIERTLAELASLSSDTTGRAPTTREVAAAGLFLANFYNGVESVLKRIRLFHGIPMPSGPTWHLELLKGFCDPPREGLPLLIAAPLEGKLAPYRRLRHVVHHGYGFRFQWEQIQPGIDAAASVFQELREAVVKHLESLSK